MGNRRQLYYAANTVIGNLIAQEEEFVLQDTLQPYTGEYCIANGTYLTGANPSPESQVLISAEGNPGIKFQTENSTKYFKLTRNEYSKHIAPVVHYPEPTAEDYEKGQFQRFFVQKINEPSRLYEIDETQYKEVNRDNKIGIDKKLYQKFEVQWMLIGIDASMINKSNIELQSKLTPGVDEYLENTMQFVKGEQRTEERYYPDGKIISAKLPIAYNVPEEQGQACLNCKFRNRNFCSKWQANIRNLYWCNSWQVMKVANTSNLSNLYTNGGEYFLNGEEYIGAYHIHPEKGPMVGAYHVSEPHEYLVPIGEESTY